MSKDRHGANEQPCTHVPGIIDAINNIFTACLSSTRDDDVRGMPELLSSIPPHAPKMRQRLNSSITGMITGPAI